MPGPKQLSESKQCSACRSSAYSCGNCNDNKKKIQRPISLLNVDTKISSKVLAKRLEHILPDLIHYNQNVYMKVRLIFDSIRTFDDVLEYTKQRRQSGIMVTIDFEKVFDSLDHEFLVKVYHTIYFGPSFTQWIRTFYSNV